MIIGHQEDSAVPLHLQQPLPQQLPAQLLPAAAAASASPRLGLTRLLQPCPAVIPIVACQVSLHCTCMPEAVVAATELKPHKRSRMLQNVAELTKDHNPAA